MEHSTVQGPVSLVRNDGPIVSGSTVTGPLTCTSNTPAPVNNGLANTIGGPPAGQCRGL
ncbi:hypothetical protein OIE66_27785 [Nonomuraea sp. NBC_01738]|uniref:hypothetical protein n=1 Tax=Nonomuraea sp. NBC_01738 TaxID=2976003 RepID=UPI002E0E6BF1|nr:hypothetical protein OIE66_27785 [Nonomuraea sp. NBC_01738]